jgi:hypothetical protein
LRNRLQELAQGEDQQEEKGVWHKQCEFYRKELDAIIVSLKGNCNFSGMNDTEKY